MKQTRKVKKIFKKRQLLKARVTLNQKWTVWRQSEMKDRQARALSVVKKLFLESLWKDQGITNQNDELVILRQKLQYHLWDLNKRGSYSRSKNYCHYVGRAHSVNRKLFMSRHTFRKFMHFSTLSGFVKERCY